MVKLIQRWIWDVGLFMICVLLATWPFWMVVFIGLGVWVVSR